MKTVVYRNTASFSDLVNLRSDDLVYIAYYDNRINQEAMD